MTTLPSSAVTDTELDTHPRRDIPDAGRLVPVTVTATDRIAPNLVRMTLRGDGLCDLLLTGPDEFFGLLMPSPGSEVPTLDTGEPNIRAAVSALDESVRPGLRWYTVRHFRRDAGEIDLDVVMHDDHPGPGARWIADASVGDRAAVWLCNAIWTRHADRPLFVADASAVPALRAILEFTADHHPGDLVRYHLRVVARNADELEAGLAEEWSDRVGSLQIVYAAAGMESEAVCAVLRRDRRSGHPAASSSCLWASGEAGMTKAVRKIAVDDWGMDRDAADWVAYWIEGRARP